MHWCSIADGLAPKAFQIRIQTGKDITRLQKSDTYERTRVEMKEFVDSTELPETEPWPISYISEDQLTLTDI